MQKKMRGAMWAACLSLSIGALPACKKKDDANKAGTSAAPAAGPAKPAGMDRAAAEKALMGHVWTGVLGGKPLKLYVINVRSNAIAVLRYGEKRAGARISISPQGKFTVASRPKPTPKGLETTRFFLTLKPDFSGLTGSAEVSAKQGFVEQSSGLGDFALAKGQALQGAPILSPQPPGSFGAAIGLQIWDEIVEIDGKKVAPGDTISTPEKVGQTVKVVVMRNGQRVELAGKVPPTRKPPQAGMAGAPTAPQAPGAPPAPAKAKDAE